MPNGQEKETEKKESSILRLINSVLMTLIALILGYVITEMRGIKQDVTFQGKEIVRLDTNQKTVMEAIKQMAEKQDIIIGNQGQIMETMKQWTDQNYIRKPQK
jgi:hypothetical protein